MECAFCHQEIKAQEEPWQSKRVADCFVHQKCLVGQLPVPAFTPGLRKKTEQELDDFIELIVAANIKHQKTHE